MLGLYESHRNLRCTNAIRLAGGHGNIRRQKHILCMDRGCEQGRHTFMRCLIL